MNSNRPECSDGRLTTDCAYSTDLGLSLAYADFADEFCKFPFGLAAETNRQPVLPRIFEFVPKTRDLCWWAKQRDAAKRHLAIYTVRPAT
jgi:hypothetical protein